MDCVTNEHITKHHCIFAYFIWTSFLHLVAHHQKPFWIRYIVLPFHVQTPQCAYLAMAHFWWRTKGPFWENFILLSDRIDIFSGNQVPHVCLMQLEYDASHWAFEVSGRIFCRETKILNCSSLLFVSCLYIYTGKISGNVIFLYIFQEKVLKGSQGIPRLNVRSQANTVPPLKNNGTGRNKKITPCSPQTESKNLLWWLLINHQNPTWNWNLVHYSLWFWNQLWNGEIKSSAINLSMSIMSHDSSKVELEGPIQQISKAWVELCNMCMFAVFDLRIHSQVSLVLAWKRPSKTFINSSARSFIGY